MIDIGFQSPLEELVREVIIDVGKRVRDSILLGKAKLSKSMTEMDGEMSESLSVNRQFLTYKLKENRLELTSERKRLLQKNLFKLENKINKLKMSYDYPNYYSESKQKPSVIVSPLSRGRYGKIPKMSEDIERKQKELQAKEFVKRLNRDKLDRVNDDRKKNNNKLILIDDAAGNNQGETNNPKLYVILPQINKGIHKGDQNSMKKENSNQLREKDFSNSPREKPGGKDLTNIKNDFTFKRNLLDAEGSNEGQQVNSLNSKHKKQPTDLTNRLSKADESIFDHSMSFKSNKKSPYYFNDPKYSKLMEIKQKYNQGNSNKPQPEGYGGDIKYISDQNNISEEDYEILKNLHS